MLKIKRSFGLNRFLIVMSAVLVSACASVNQPAVVKAAPTISVAMTKAAQSQITPDNAINILKKGNDRFTTGKMLKRDLLAQEKASGVNGQFPIASVVACIDSRSDPALVFDQGLGDIFVARVAGNIVNDDTLGSLEYAAKVAGSKVIVVLGHTHCGAVKGACDNVKMGNLTQLVAKISPAVKATPSIQGDEDRTSKSHHFVDAVAEMNVKMTVNSISEKSAILKEMTKNGEIKIVGAMLDVETGKITFNEN